MFLPTILFFAVFHFFGCILRTLCSFYLRIAVLKNPKPAHQEISFRSDNRLPATRPRKSGPPRRRETCPFPHKCKFFVLIYVFKLQYTCICLWQCRLVPLISSEYIEFEGNWNYIFMKDKYYILHINHTNYSFISFIGMLPSGCYVRAAKLCKKFFLNGTSLIGASFFRMEHLSLRGTDRSHEVVIVQITRGKVLLTAVQENLKDSLTFLSHAVYSQY